MARFKAEVVVTYPNEEGDWSVLRLSKFEAEYLRSALDLAMRNGHSTDSVQIENPAAYAE